MHKGIELENCNNRRNNYRCSVYLENKTITETQVCGQIMYYEKKNRNIIIIFKISRVKFKYKNIRRIGSSNQPNLCKSFILFYNNLGLLVK